MTTKTSMLLKTAAIVAVTVCVASGVSRAQYYGDGFGSFQDPITGAPRLWDELNHNLMRMELQQLQFQQQIESLNARRELYRLHQEQEEVKRLQELQRLENLNRDAAAKAHSR